MELLLERKLLSDIAALGELSIDGAFECYTLEPPVREITGEPVELWKVPDDTAIPCGRFRVMKRWSEHFQRFVPGLEAVPGFTDIEMHVGNTVADTKGCILLGKHRVLDPPGTYQITRSVPAFEDFFAKFDRAVTDGADVWISVANSAPAAGNRIWPYA